MSRQKRERAVRRSRWLLRGMGAFLIAIVMVISKDPERSPPGAAAICFALGILFLAIGNFASGKWVYRSIGILNK